ncbi:MAG: DUF4838 domain-containing protein [Lentisphaerae bacterium]|nr:DUF4838 domain-containing protein [Lentisphaerota bacterium]MBT5610107.1 DUF4838 domain-containing protein [Lentisphaerota bacterium]MBT7054193.1 DUF4838 domain-containing protein [Lentisphaerota bacterium]MBT7848511.1 DUF4838 domain-containing protein [Lentisphaerota bacterium]
MPDSTRNCMRIAMACLTALSARLSGQTRAPLPLASDAKTPYVIVIGKQACAAEEHAAKELAYFLEEMTDVEFPIRRDDAATSNHEIVLGRTSRLSLQTIAPELQPEVNEGFAILREDARLFILGRIPRATLYGVYDFLEVELGVRFLAPEVNHVPRRTTLECDVTSRKYDPPLEYRNIYSNPEWAVRNRLNATWGWCPMRVMLGGCEYIGRSNHTLPVLLPHDEHFDQHPEYFAFVDGKRRKTTVPSGAHRAHPCLTNPGVLRIVVENVRKTIEDYRKHPGMYNPYSQLVVPVEYDDHDQVCQCAECRAVNREEGTDGGTLFRFLNTVAEAIEKDYPNVSIGALAYQATETPPKKTRLRKNVIIRFAPITSDFARAFDDPRSERNRASYRNLVAWSEATDRFHAWYYITNFSPFMVPFPDLRGLAANFRLLHQHGMRGLFTESSYSPGPSLRQLRHYLVAKLMWRPDTDARETIEEFCRLYYGKGGNTVLEYVDSLHDYHFAEVDPEGKNPLTCRGAPPYRHAYDDDFIAEADATLDRAEAEAETAPEKQRVAVARLSIWYLMLTKEMERKGSVLSLPIEWAFRLDPKDVGLKEGWERQTDFSDWDRVRTDDFWTKQGHDYHGAAWYATSFDLPAPVAAGSLSLYFGAVDGLCDAFIDGDKIGEQKESPGVMWNQGFYLPIKNAIGPEKHRLVVRVEKETHAAGIWKPVSFVDLSQPVSEGIRIAGTRFIEVSQKAGVTRISGGPDPAKAVKNLYARIRSLLERKPYRPENPTDGAIRKPAATLSNPHETYSVVKDETAEHGSCLVQTADRQWTFGQSIRWNITPHLKEARKHARQYRLRIRIKIDKQGDDGNAFRFGYSYTNLHTWAGGPCAAVTVKARDVKDGEWQWYELTAPLELKEGVRCQDAFVWPRNNPENVSAVYVDSFELVRVAP